MLSVIIPSRSDRHLTKTIEDLLNKAHGDIEVIVILDGYWPVNYNGIQDIRVKTIHHGRQHENFGMRNSINLGVSMSSGEYIMKIDEHCIIDDGYDIKLTESCEDNWVVIPRRYRLNQDKWEVDKKSKQPVDNSYLTYPFSNITNTDSGLHAIEWRDSGVKVVKGISDSMSFQGSCYLMSRKHWDSIGGLSTIGYGSFAQEAQEIGNKTWLGGGRVVTNSNVWYAHLHKQKKDGNGYLFCNKQTRDFFSSRRSARIYCIDYWLNNKWEDRVHNFKWLVDRFYPIPGWPDDWMEHTNDLNNINIK